MSELEDAVLYTIFAPLVVVCGVWLALLFNLYGMEMTWQTGVVVMFFGLYSYTMGVYDGQNDSSETFDAGN